MAASEDKPDSEDEPGFDPNDADEQKGVLWDIPAGEVWDVPEPYDATAHRPPPPVPPSSERADE